MFPLFYLFIEESIIDFGYNDYKYFGHQQRIFIFHGKFKVFDIRVNLGINVAYKKVKKIVFICFFKKRKSVHYIVIVLEDVKQLKHVKN